MEREIVTVRIRLMIKYLNRLRGGEIIRNAKSFSASIRGDR